MSKINAYSVVNLRRQIYLIQYENIFLRFNYDLRDIYIRQSFMICKILGAHEINRVSASMHM